MQKHVHPVYNVINRYHVIVCICNVHQRFISFSTNPKGTTWTLPPKHHYNDAPDTVMVGQPQDHDELSTQQKQRGGSFFLCLGS